MFKNSFKSSHGNLAKRQPIKITISNQRPVQQLKISPSPEQPSLHQETTRITAFTGDIEEERCTPSSSDPTSPRLSAPDSLRCHLLSGAQTNDPELEENRQLILKLFTEKAKLTAEKDATVTDYLKLQYETQGQAAQYEVLKLKHEYLEARLNKTAMGSVTPIDVAFKKSKELIEKNRLALEKADQNSRELRQTVLDGERVQWQYSEQVELMKKEILEKDQKIAELAIQKNGANDRELAEKDKQLSAMIIELQSDAEMIHQTQKWVDASRHHLRDQEGWLHELETKNNKLRNENADLKGGMWQLTGENKKLATENEELKAKLKMFEEVETNLWQTLLERQVKKEDVEEDQEELTEKPEDSLVRALANRLEKDAAIIKDQNWKLENVSMKQKQIQKDSAEMDELRLKMSEMEQQNQSNMDTINGLRSQVRSTEELREKSERDDATIKRLEGELRKKETELHAARGRIIHLEQQRAAAKDKDKNALQSELEDQLRKTSLRLQEKTDVEMEWRTANANLKQQLRQKSLELDNRRPLFADGSQSDALSALHEELKEEREKNVKLEENDEKLQLNSEMLYSEKLKLQNDVVLLKAESKRLRYERNELRKLREATKAPTSSNELQAMKRRRTDGPGSSD